MTQEKKELNPEKMKITPAHYFLFFLIFLNIYACYNMIRPYLDPIILAGILAILLKPAYEWIQKKVKGRKNLAAFLCCVFLTIVIVLPCTVMFVVVINQGIHSFKGIYEFVAAGNFEKIIEYPLVVKAVSLAQNYFPELDLKKLNLSKTMLNASQSAGKLLVNQGGHLVGNITLLVAKFLMMIFAFFFIVMDQEKIFNYILHLSPLSSEHEKQILHKVKAVSKSALLGSLITAVAQGTAGGIGFMIVGLPGFFWGAVMAFSSLIPVVGTAIIWVPAAGFLFISGHWIKGIFLVLYCVIIVGVLDNIVRPLFMKGSAGMSTMLIFFAILGGINMFGLIGILYGPLIFGLTMVLLYIYDLEFGSFLSYQDKH